MEGCVRRREFRGEDEATPRAGVNNKGSLLQSEIGKPEKDIGTTSISQKEVITDLQSDEQTVLQKVYQVVGPAQVTRKKMENAPSWILDAAMKSEKESKWRDAYVPVFEKDLPKDAKVISSHIVYKIKSDEAAILKMKARLCPHGNRDSGRNYVRKDSATAQFDMIRLMLSIATLLPFRIGLIDIKGAYRQSGPIKRDIYVRPPIEVGEKRGVIWKLVKLPYGITEAGRQ